MRRKSFQKFIIAFAMALLVTTVSSDVFAKSWRDITPLHSTAEDVRRLFPGCEEKPTGCYLASEDQEIIITYSGGNKLFASECKDKDIPKGTVLAVIVRFRSSRKLQDFKLQGERFTTFNSSQPPQPGYKAYYYRRAGFIINTYEGKVIGLAYLATDKDFPLCPEYYDDPKGFVAIGRGHERLP